MLVRILWLAVARGWRTDMARSSPVAALVFPSASVQRTKIRPASSTCAGRTPRDDIEIGRSKPSCPASKIEFFDYFDCLDFEKLA
jgi:hypothetical protein